MSATSGTRRFWTAMFSALPKVAGSRLIVLTSAGDPAHWSHRVLGEALAAPARWRVSQVAGPAPGWIRSISTSSDGCCCVGEDPDDVGAAADLLVEPLLGVVRPIAQRPAQRFTCEGIPEVPTPGELYDLAPEEILLVRSGAVPATEESDVA